MQKKQYSISEFAAVNKISARMLRHYDKIGLFRPGAVLQNGYRSYSSEQIPVISLIKKYQSCGFTLAEISRLLPADEEETATLAKEKWRQLSAQSFQQDKALRQLLLLSGECISPFPNDYAVSYTRQPERLLLCGAGSADDSEIEAAFDELYNSLRAADIHPTGLPLILSDLEDGCKPYYVAVPVMQEAIHTGLVCRTLLSGWYLSTLHYGGYDDIGMAYDRLICLAQEKNQRLAPPFLERYFLDGAHTANPAEYITEISIKITP